jgi:hypothetical protein
VALDLRTFELSDLRILGPVILLTIVVMILYRDRTAEAARRIKKLRYTSHGSHHD